jgi:hypothetical protein
MDHYPIPPETEPILIPYIGTYEYDGGDFLTYPKRNGWTRSQLNGEDNFGNRSRARVEGFFQAWLYFGFATEVFKIININ